MTEIYLFFVILTNMSYKIKIILTLLSFLIIFPMFFSWCNYSEFGFDGSIMLFFPTVLPCLVYMVVGNKKNLVIAASLVLTVSYIFPPIYLISQLSFLQVGIHNIIKVCTVNVYVSFISSVTLSLYKLRILNQ